jgi:hypothetical protein
LQWCHPASGPLQKHRQTSLEPYNFRGNTFHRLFPNFPFVCYMKINFY